MPLTLQYTTLEHKYSHSCSNGIHVPSEICEIGLLTLNPTWIFGHESFKVIKLIIAYYAQRQ